MLRDAWKAVDKGQVPGDGLSWTAARRRMAMQKIRESVDKKETRSASATQTVEKKSYGNTLLPPGLREHAEEFDLPRSSNSSVHSVISAETPSNAATAVPDEASTTDNQTLFSSDSVGSETDDDEDMHMDTDLELLQSKSNPWQIRLIDFAHTRMAFGEGPDEGFLLGLRGIKKLIEGRIEEIENIVAGAKSGEK